MLKKILDYLKNNKIFIDLKQKKYNDLIRNTKLKKKISILFLTNHISQWKYQSLYRIFSLNKRYKCHVVLIPDENYDKNYNHSYKFNKKEFQNLNIDLISSYDFNLSNWIDLNEKFKPDIVFFPRALNKYKNKYSIHNFNNSLNCYVPYSLHIDNNDKIQCATYFHQLLWKQFLPFKDNLEIAKKNYNADNVVITDYPGCDEFKISKYRKCIWKNNNFKKVIWAPHHTIEFYNKKNFFSTFLNINQQMIDLSIKYKDSIDFCFKPHPGLKEKLYMHKEWGKEKTLNYFNFWKNSSNTILSETNYQNLFIESDALILDSVSFTAEYLYLNKPLCFLTKFNFDYNSSLNIIGIKIFDEIIKAFNANEIIEFLDKSVLKNDIVTIEKQKKLLNRLNIFNHQNVPACENIYNYINKSLSI
tara:strand:- start:459 stop:1706 length:1248 start_codon:yes stop_codon:yes gene_type:complete